MREVATWLPRLVAAAAIALASPALGAPLPGWPHDTDGDKIDDRLRLIEAGGFAAAFENGDLSARKLFAVEQAIPLEYHVYVGYEIHPTALDEQAVAAIVGPQSFVHTYVHIDYIWTRATLPQLELIAQLPGVVRIEAMPMAYADNHMGSRVVRARASEGLSTLDNFTLFPNVRDHLGFDGTGIVVAILDTGVNDEVDNVNPNFPGHESLRGKWVGGGEFWANNPVSNTPHNQSVNPKDHGSFHGSHTAGSAIGSGGQDNFFTGVAPKARLVDCKVLSDAGSSPGGAAAAGVDWCISNRNTDWGLTGPDAIYRGIQVINMSLSSGASNGTDASSQMANNAVSAGIVLCASTGNGTAINQINAPAAGDLVIAVGSANHKGTLKIDDDQVSDFSNEGPRASDGDADRFDEYKPNVVGPGSGIISANGDFLSDGEGYVRNNGTSMSAPHVAGVAALVRQAKPSLTPLQVRKILQETAWHHLPTEKATQRAADPFNIDKNYSPMSGYGMVDAYAAVLEALNSTSGVQVVRIKADARASAGEIDVKWWTQREYPFQGFHVYRAPDVAGAPGAFARITPVLVLPQGDPVIDGSQPLGNTNRTPYVYVDNGPGLQLGAKYWYQVEWVSASGQANPQPPVQVQFSTKPLVATLFYSIQHNTPDNDLVVRLGRSSAYSPELAEFLVYGGGTGNVDSTVVREPANAATATTGYQERFWSDDLVVDDGAGSFLPPSMASPWFLDVKDGCFINRTGTINSFSMFVHDAPGSASGQTYLSDSVFPALLKETCSLVGPVPTTTVWIPEQRPVSATVLRMAAEAGEGAIVIRLELARDLPGATALVSRSSSSEFASRQALTESPLALDGREFAFEDAEIEPGTTYWYWVEIRQADGSSFMNGPVSVTASAGPLALTFAAAPAPNPMAGSTTFGYTLGRDLGAGGDVSVRLALHDERGRLIRTLFAGEQAPGQYALTWDRTDDRGRRVGPGVYFYRFQAGPVTRTAKVVVAR